MLFVLGDLKFFFIFYFSQFIIPGFIDTHVHASQFPNVGLSMGTSSVEWLQSSIYPTEANFQDTLFARDIYSKAVVGFYFLFCESIFFLEGCKKTIESGYGAQCMVTDVEVDQRGDEWMEQKFKCKRAKQPLRKRLNESV